MPEAARASRAGGAQRRGIDDAESASRIDCVMSALRLSVNDKNCECRQRAQSDVSSARRPGRERPSGPRCGPRGTSWRGVAHVPIAFTVNPGTRGTDRPRQNDQRADLRMTRKFNRRFGKQPIDGCRRPCQA